MCKMIHTHTEVGSPIADVGSTERQEQKQHADLESRPG